MSFKEGYDFGHLRDRRSPFDQCVGMVLSANLDELEIYDGNDDAKRGVAEDIAATLYEDVDDWQSHFAGRLASYASGVESDETQPQVPALPTDPRALTKPSRISA